VGQAAGTGRGVTIASRGSTPSVGVIAFSRLTHDARVMRTIKALSAAGYDVSAVGFGAQPPGTSRFIELPTPVLGIPNRVGMVLRHAPANLAPAMALRLHGMSELHRAARDAVVKLRPDIIHANDWPTLPSAVAAKTAYGARIVYDSHEFGIEEHAHR